MNLFGHVLISIIGIVVIILSAHCVFKSSITIAKRFALSDEFIGMTILSIGTSLPEIVTHLVASLKIIREPVLMNELSALSVGTNIGSDIFQQNFILGFVALIASMTVSRKDLVKDVGALVIVTIIVFLFSIGGTITRLEGGILVLGYIGYLHILKKHGGREISKYGEEDKKKWIKSISVNILIATLGFVVMALAADKVLDSAIVIVEKTFLSYSLFGVLILGVAAALPELSTSLISVIRKKVAISSGILVGSNITNPAFALGAGACISTYKIPLVITWYDLPFKIATAMLIYFMLKRKTMVKKHALILILFYIVYIFVRQKYFTVDF